MWRRSETWVAVLGAAAAAAVKVGAVPEWFVQLVPGAVVYVFGRLVHHAANKPQA